jgi:hypothetical protein
VQLERFLRSSSPKALHMVSSTNKLKGIKILVIVLSVPYFSALKVKYEATAFTS